MTNNKQFFLDRRSELQKKQEDLNARGRRFSFFRLVVFIVFSVFLIFGLFNKINTVVAFICSAVFLIAFIILCIKHNKLKNELEMLNVLASINEEYLSRIDGDFNLLTDSGEEYIDSTHNYSVDLDIFGKVSIFSKYNLAETCFGRDLFAYNLTHTAFSDVSNDEILRRQKAVSELISKPDFIQEFQALSRLVAIKKTPKAIIDLASDSSSVSKPVNAFSKIIPAIWLIPFISLFIFPSFTSLCVLGCLIINLLIFILVSGKYNQGFKTVDKVSIQCRNIYKLFSMLESENFDNSYLKDIVKSSSKTKATDGLIALSKACTFLSFRSQPLLALILNLIVPFDIYCANKLNKWSSSYGSEFDDDIKSIAKFEMLMSLACIGIVSKNSSFPVISDKPIFHGQDISHPLIKPDSCVSNSIVLERIGIITGSNMSGKTTLIRTVGLSCVLAAIGAPVLATNVECGRFTVISSMRIMDNIGENMSTFKAELVRIEKIIRLAETDNSILFLIDEIFRGTNSTDRTEGALTVLNKLNKDNIIGLMTTHDYSLCDKVLEQKKDFVYYYFTETYNETGLTFDYKLREGISRQSNAKYLMKLVGITDDKE